MKLKLRFNKLNNNILLIQHIDLARAKSKTLVNNFII